MTKSQTKQWEAPLSKASPIKEESLAIWLKGYQPDKFQYLISGFSDGFKIHFSGTPSCQQVKNLKSAEDNPSVIDQYIKKEIQAGRVEGPFHEPPFPKFQISPLGVVPKKQVGEYRVIHHLSYPEGKSINDGIDTAFTTVEYASIETAIRLVKQAGIGSHMAKTDVKSAFRLIPVHPEAHPLFCFQWKDKYYFDKCLQMGCSSSCQIFEEFSKAIEWIAQKKLNVENMTHMLDDFFMVNSTKTQCSKDLSRFLAMCKDVNIPIAQEKTCGPATVMSFVGYEIDSIKSEVRLPQEKVEKCKQAISDILPKKKIQLKELQSVIGMLNFACGVVIPGRAFLRRLIDLTIGVKKPFHHIRVTAEAKEDLQVWQHFLQEFNGKSLFLSEMFLTTDVRHLYTDAAKGFGFGAVLGSQWFLGTWTEWWSEQNITLLELVPIVLALEAWRDPLRNKTVMLHTDNAALVWVINKQSSKEKLVMKLVRRLVRACLNFNILCQAQHVPGEINKSADALSRLQVDRFRTLQPGADKHPSQFPNLPLTLNS